MNAIPTKQSSARTQRARPVPGPAISPAGSLVDLVRRSLDDDKADDVIVIDLAGKSSIADTLIIASGRSARQVTAMADHLVETLGRAQPWPVKVEGLPAADWVLIDAGDIVIHLFRPEVRAFYNLEKMWDVDPPARPLTPQPRV